MDIQTKIIFTINTVVKDKENTYIKDAEKKIVSISRNKISIDSNLEFDEYKQVLVEIESEDEGAYLEIDSYKSIEGSPVVIRVNQEKEEINPGGSHNNMLVPGIYIFKIFINNKEQYLEYKILPSHMMKLDGILKLREYVEKMCVGLSYNFYKERLSLFSNTSKDNNNIFEIYRNHINEFDKILTTINSIIRNPIETLAKDYKEKTYSFRPDAKSRRWSKLKPYSSVHEKSIVLTVNTIENRWVKKIINNMIRDITQLIYKLNQNINKIEIEKNIKATEKDIRISKYSIIKNTYDISQNDKLEVNNKVTRLVNEIHSINQKKIKIEEYIYILNNQKSKLYYFVNITWLKSIDMKVKKTTLSMIKDSRYSYLLSVYNKSNFDNNNYNEKYITNFANKATPLLFEYYVLIHIIKIIKNNGYKWIDDCENNIFNYIFENSELSKEVITIFKGEKYDLELAYDVEVEKESKCKEKGFISCNARHRRPDIRLSLYRKTGEIEKSIIIEVKCRKASCIYDSMVENQIRDYKYGFRYKENNEKKDIVKKVIVVCLHQENDNNRYEYEDEDILCLPISITDREEISPNYDKFKKEIGSILNIQY